MIYVSGVFNAKSLSLYQRKLEMFLDGRPTNFKLCVDGVMLMWLKIVMIQGRKAMKGLLSGSNGSLMQIESVMKLPIVWLAYVDSPWRPAIWPHASR
jgi:hypothetical protein